MQRLSDAITPAFGNGTPAAARPALAPREQRLEIARHSGRVGRLRPSISEQREG